MVNTSLGIGRVLVYLWRKAEITWTRLWGIVLIGLISLRPALLDINTLLQGPPKKSAHTGAGPMREE